MPCTPEAVHILKKASVLIAPAMAAGAGGVGFLLLFSYVYCIHIPTVITVTLMIVLVLVVRATLTEYVNTLTENVYYIHLN